MPPWHLLAGAQGAGPDAADLKDRARLKEQEFADLHRTWMELERDLLSKEKDVLELQEALDTFSKDLLSVRKQRDKSQRLMGSVHQSQILGEKKQLQAKAAESEKVLSQIKAMRAVGKGSQLDGRCQVSAVKGDLLRLSEASQRELKAQTEAEEEALSSGHAAELEDIARAERRVLADCEASEREFKVLIAEVSKCRSEASEAREAMRRADAERTSKESQISEEKNRLQAVLDAKGRLQDEKRDLELELENAEKSIRRLARDQPLVQQLPPSLGTSSTRGQVTNASLLCLQAELASQREALARDIAGAKQEVAMEEAALRLAQEASSDRHAAAADRRQAIFELQGFELQRRVLSEAAEERRVAAENLRSARAEVERLTHLASKDAGGGVESGGAEDAGSPRSLSVSMISDHECEGWMKVAVQTFVPDGDEKAEASQLRDALQRAEQQLAEAERHESAASQSYGEVSAALPSQASPAPQGGESSRLRQELQALASSAHELEDQCLILEQEKKHLDLQLAAAQFSLRRLQGRSASPTVGRALVGCPFCEHCSPSAAAA
ncbi:unnamed protein product [Polarella glacialis]|uniref:Uncharacterized protein n=1 Tax=Polarella glacialis TaxID=89957 RepID=A0A813FL62_POLGL|nr:unnamed protein product [Polarella glacialis]